MKKIVLNILMCFILLVSCSENQVVGKGNGVIKGRVVDSRTSLPIENAKISSSPATSTFVSDKDGYFVFNAVPEGDYSFKAEKDGYIARFLPATATMNITREILFELHISTDNNKPPEIPVLTAPVDNVKGQLLKLNLSWTASDKESDPLTFVVTLKNLTTDVVKTYPDIKTTTLEISGLSYSTKYSWQVSASDGINTPTNSVTSSFTTLAFPNPRFLYIKKVNNNNVIYTADEALNELQLSPSEVNSYRPRKNLEIKKIAFIGSDGSQNHIYTMNEDGSGITKVTNSIPIAGFNMEHVSYCWSTNGSQLIYPNFDKLYRINADGSGLVQLFQTPNGKFISECAWSHDGSQIVLKVNNGSGYKVEIYVINTSGVRLYDVLLETTGAVSGLDISFNNNKIIYTRDVSGNENSVYRRFDSRIFIYDAGTNLTTELSAGKQDGFNNFDVKFSPNEAEVIYTNTSNDGISPNNIQKANNSTSSSGTDLFKGGSMPEWK